MDSIEAGLNELPFSMDLVAVSNPRLSHGSTISKIGKELPPDFRYLVSSWKDLARLRS